MQYGVLEYADWAFTFQILDLPTIDDSVFSYDSSAINVLKNDWQDYCSWRFGVRPAVPIVGGCDF